MVENLAIGDDVIHRDKSVAQGQPIKVVDVDTQRQQAKCEFFSSDGIHQANWFNFFDLTVVKYI
jgi:hypothetical protein